MRAVLLSVPLLVAIPLAAQKGKPYLVSPAGHATLEGNSNNIYPWGQAQSHYQQIHADLRSRTLVILGLAWRRDGQFSSIAARTLDLELSVGDSDLAKATATFASNYVGTPTVAVKRKKIVMPSWTWTPSTPRLPGPFDFEIPFDTPWLFSGKQDFCWEVKLFPSGAAQRSIADATRVAISGNAAKNLMIGQGCTLAGQKKPMTLEASVVVDPSWKMSLQWLCRNTAPSATGNVVLIGLSNPAAPIPGFCSQKLYTDALLAFTAPASNASGIFATTQLTSYSWAGLTGKSLYAQAVSSDPSRTPPYAASSGLQTIIPKPGSGGSWCRLWNNTSATALSGSMGLDYALVTKVIGI